MTPDKSRGLLDRVGDAVLEPVARDGEWLGPIITTAILFLFIFAIPAIFGGL